MNKADEWGGHPRCPHKFYSIFGLSPAVRTPSGGGNLPQILELYEDCDLSDRRKLAEANANL